MKNFDIKDIFKVDETGLFYRMDPNKSLTSSDTKGKKKKKDRITVALCCNADGSEKIKPFVIGKLLNPRCFKNISVQLYMDYKANKKAWMTSFLFADFLHSFNAKMKRSKRKVLLIMDNAPRPRIATVVKRKNSFSAPDNDQSFTTFRCWYHSKLQMLLPNISTKNVQKTRWLPNC